MKGRGKVIYIILLAVFTAAAGVVLFRTGSDMQVKGIAKERLKEDISALEKGISRMEAEKQGAVSEINKLNESMSEQSFLSDQISENRDTYMELTKSIDEKKKKISKLDGDIASKTETIRKLDEISLKETGDRKKLDPRFTYSCPADYEPGFYRISGYGTLLVYSPRNSLRISENLAALDTYSFVFNLEENERIKIDETMEIVKIE